MMSGTPPKPTPARTNPLLDRLDPAQCKVLLVGLIAFFLLAGFSTLLVAYVAFEPEIMAYFNTPTPTLTPTPTPQCVQPTLTLGTSIYPLDVVTLNTDGSLPTPTGAAGSAWWV